MRRAEIWTAVGRTDFTGKPRPVVIVQDTHFDELGSITVCPFTTDGEDLPLFRVVVEPSDANGLRHLSRIMVDKIVTLRKDRLHAHIGLLGDEDMLRLNRALLVFLGLAE